MLDTSKIAGYDEMTAEEKVKALENLETHEDELTRLKNALNKSNADAAEWKRQYRATQDEKTRAEEEAKEKAEEVEKELNALRKEREISTYKASYLSLGYDDDLASAAAEAMANGEIAKVFEAQKVFNEKKEAEHKASLINAQPGITPGEHETKPLTKAEILAIKNREERYRLIEENKDLF